MEWVFYLLACLVSFIFGSFVDFKWYNKRMADKIMGEIVVDQNDPEKDLFTIVLDRDSSEILKRKFVMFKVVMSESVKGDNNVI